VPFSVNTVGGHVHAIPADAVPLMRSGRLDPRLFDVTDLLDFHYDDASGADLPLIVTSASGSPRLGRLAVPAGVRVTRELPGVRGAAATVDHAGLPAVWRTIRAAGTGAAAPRIWLDGVRRLSLDVSVPQIGAPIAWQAGFTGAGVKVAVVDSGIDGTHPDLAGQVIAHRTFVDGEDDLDHVGHGTHVAATVAGTGSGRFKGVAPGAKLIDAKVCTVVDCPDSAIIAGLQWAVAEQGAAVVNISLGAPDTPEVDPVEQAVQDLTAQYGALFVIAAGNSGADRSIDSPGSADAALAVGAVDRTDTLASFSSRGPRVGDAALKPDITAPGVDITAAAARTPNWASRASST
jgi:subtilisin family serine protease